MMNLMHGLPTTMMNLMPQGGGFYLLGVQLLGVVSISAWTAVTAFILLKAIDLTVGLRIPLEEELLGADIVEHGVGDVTYDKVTKQLIPVKDDPQFYLDADMHVKAVDEEYNEHIASTSRVPLRNRTHVSEARRKSLVYDGGTHAFGAKVSMRRPIRERIPSWTPMTQEQYSDSFSNGGESSHDSTRESLPAVAVKGHRKASRKLKGGFTFTNLFRKTKRRRWQKDVQGGNVAQNGSRSVSTAPPDPDANPRKGTMTVTVDSLGSCDHNSLSQREQRRISMDNIGYIEEECPSDILQSCKL